MLQLRLQDPALAYQSLIGTQSLKHILGSAFYHTLSQEPILPSGKRKH